MCSTVELRAEIISLGMYSDLEIWSSPLVKTSVIIITKFEGCKVYDQRTVKKVRGGAMTHVQ